MTVDSFALCPEMLDHSYREMAPSQNATSTSQSSSLGPSERDTPPRTAQVLCAFLKHSLPCIMFSWCQSCDMKQ